MGAAADLGGLARQLMWSQATVERLREDATRAQLAFLADAMGAELANRDQARRARLRRKAAFGSAKGFDGFDWSHVTLPAALTRDDVTGCGFVEAKQNLVLYGPVGTGKTHLATAVGMAACAKGLETRFHTVSDLLVRLAAAKQDGTLGRFTRGLARARLVILDEFGYIPVDRDAARLLFNVMADCYEARSLVITTNTPFSNWGSVLTDDQLAAALIDRVAHHGHLVVFDGDSYRMRHALMRQAATPQDPR
jgi:DNA replication protein DnaC